MRRGVSSRSRPRVSGSRTRSTRRRSSRRRRSSSGSASRVEPRPMRRTSTSRTVRLPRAGKYWLLAEPEGGSDEGAGARATSSSSKEDPPPDVGDPAIASRDADARLDGRRHRGAHDAHAAGRVAAPLLGRRLARGEGAVRRDVRDAEVLLEPNVRSGRRRRRGGGAPLRGRRRALHPRRGVRGQRPGEGLQPLDAGVEAPDRAVDVPRRRATGRSSSASRARSR